MSIYLSNFDFSKTPMQRVLKKSTLSNAIREAQYAVRGELAIKAHKMEHAGEKVIHCNIGNPQSLNQKPITFLRQVSALCDYPELIKHDFPADVKQRATQILKACKSVGSYSNSKGIPYIRNKVARFIEERDGHPSNPEHIFLTDGASPAVKMAIQLLVQNDNCGVMIPIPQYPLYSASIILSGGKIVEYHMTEKGGWDIDLDNIEKSVETARAQGIDVRAICVINPGNPIGNVMSLESMQAIIKFCYSKGLVLLADEVYQTNVYLNKPWYSFKKVLSDMPEYKVELFSFHSTSKGVIGECGRRGGYVEAVNIDQDVLDELYKLASINLCSNVMGQIGVDLMVDPPRPSDPSYSLYKEETTGIFDSLKRRAELLVDALHELPGIECNAAEGAMYIFAKLDLPQKYIQKAKEMKKEPDTLYCLELLENTGVCVVPGNGFGQGKNTFHFRATFLPPEEEFEGFIKKMKTFHTKLMHTYQ